MYNKNEANLDNKVLEMDIEYLGLPVNVYYR